LVARAGFYLLLTGLVLNIAASGGTDSRQADAHGALATVAANPVGKAAVVAVAAGFLGFGLARMWGAWQDDRTPAWRRVMTACQGTFYLALTWIPMSYVLGKQSTGSNRSEHRTAGDLLGLPAGREIVAALGVVVVGVCVNQVRTALTDEYADGMQLRGAAHWVQWLVRGAARVGIPARALVFVPVGGFLVVAAVQSDPRHAEGLDEVLGKLAGRWWGVLMLAVIAAGLLVFALYSLLEAKYRRVTRAE
jgi:hypothetical protein